MSDTNARILMVGTGDFAVPTLVHLLRNGQTVVGLITQPERPQGRKQELVESAIKRIASEARVPVFQPQNVNDDGFLDTVRSLAVDIMVTAAYGQILSKELLAIPSFGGLNLHGSLLPAYRGASPVARAIQHGETETGVTVIQMSPRIDAGGMLAAASTRIDPNETAGELEARLANLGAPLMLAVLQDVLAGRALSLPQDRTRVSRAPKLTKQDGLIDWNQSAPQIHNLVRAMQPWPTAATTWHAAAGGPDLRMLVHKSQPVAGVGEAGVPLSLDPSLGLVVAAGTGAVRLLEIQLVGKKKMSDEAFLRGHRLDPACRFVSA
jgi:methionyl-tRNA formyltransferase